MVERVQGGEAVKVEKTGGVSPNCTRGVRWWPWWRKFGDAGFSTLTARGVYPPFGGAVWGVVVWSGIYNFERTAIVAAFTV